VQQVAHAIGQALFTVYPVELGMACAPAFDYVLDGLVQIANALVAESLTQDQVTLLVVGAELV
tara:strand:- start:220 stop:408 length:189 start_codon:yes stop_codon:yes gene_type:complete